MRSRERLLAGAAGEAQREFDTCLTRLNRVAPCELDPDATTSLLRWISGAIDQLELLRARTVASLENAKVYETSGATDMVGFVANQCGMTPEAAHDRVLLARQLDSLSSTVDQLSDGRLSFDEATVVARGAAKMRAGDVPRVEAMILAKAGSVPVSRLRQLGQTIVAEVDAEVLRRDAGRARERRTLRIGPDVDGLATISGSLTSMCAAELRASLEPYMCPVDNHDRRTAEQRRHDALHEVCRKPSATSAVGEGGTSGQRGRITPRGRRKDLVVVAEVATLMGEDGPPALLQGLVPISHEELDQFVEDAHLSLVLKDAKGNIAFAGRSARLFSSLKKRAVSAVNPTCVFEGCTRPAVDCTGHHLVEFTLGGETTLADEAPLCMPHQERVHRDGWCVVRGPDGGYQTLPPGHPDAPASRLSPDEYRRRRRAAILRRRQSRRTRRQTRAEPSPPAG